MHNDQVTANLSYLYSCKNQERNITLHNDQVTANLSYLYSCKNQERNITLHNDQVTAHLSYLYRSQANTAYFSHVLREEDVALASCP